MKDGIVWFIIGLGQGILIRDWFLAKQLNRRDNHEILTNITDIASDSRRSAVVQRPRSSKANTNTSTA